jgi:hypothetical protein
MRDQYTLCHDCDSLAQCFDREVSQGELREHYQCDSCGCYYIVSYLLRDREVMLPDEVQS